MDTLQLITSITSAIATVGGVVAAILAWVAKIRWSNEFANAKDETIKSKEAQVEALKERVDFYKEINSGVIFKHLVDQRSRLDEIVEDLKYELSEKDKQIQKISNELDRKIVRTEIQQRELQELKDDLEKEKLSKSIFISHLEEDISGLDAYFTLFASFQREEGKHMIFPDKFSYDDYKKSDTESPQLFELPNEDDSDKTSSNRKNEENK